MKCPKCESDVLFFMEGVCKVCHSKGFKASESAVESETTPEATRRVIKYHNLNEYNPRCPQRASTVKLRGKVSRYMTSRKWNYTRMAKHLGLRTDRFAHWFDGKYSESFQLRYNDKIRKVMG